MDNLLYCHRPTFTYNCNCCNKMHTIKEMNESYSHALIRAVIKGLVDLGHVGIAALLCSSIMVSFLRRPISK